MGKLKQLDKKFLIFIVCLIVIPILLIVFLIMAQSCSNKKADYSSYESKMRSAANDYLTKIDEVPSEDGDYIVVGLDTLVEGKYIESTEEVLGDKTCTGHVGVRKENKLVYNAVLVCDEYKTNTLAESLKKDLVTEGDGLYKTGDSYTFKGLKTKNYLVLEGEAYVILGIDENNVVRALKIEDEGEDIEWDIKYNIHTGDNTGINIYNDSYLLEVIKYAYDYEEFEDIKPYIISNDICIYSKKIEDTKLNKSECKEVIKNQYYSLIDIDDYMNASLDKNCKDVYSYSCENYNYLARLSIATWTKNVVADNDYQVYYFSNGLPKVEDASETESYHFVIFLDGDILVQSGNGSNDDPYRLK